MTLEERELRQLVEALERDQGKPAASPADWPTVHHSQIPELLAGSPLAVEWNFYRRIVADLIAAGSVGHWVLIRRDEVLGVWPTQDEAEVTRSRFAEEPMLVKQIVEREPILKMGYNRACLS